MSGRPATLARLVLGLLLLGAMPAGAEIAVTYHDRRGEAVAGETLYPVHRALILATEGGAEPARREALAAWLATLGLDVETVAGPEAMARLMAWIDAGADAADAGVLVVLDGAVTRDWRAEGQRLILDPGPGAAEPVDLDRVMTALDRMRARHVAAVFTAPLSLGDTGWARPDAPGPPPDRAWLTAEAARPARQAMAPLFDGADVLGALVSSLGQSPEAGETAFDPDAFLTLGDLARADPALALWRFGAADAGGDMVLMERVPVLLPFEGVHPRDAYRAVRFDAGGEALVRFLASHGDDATRWTAAAARQRVLVERRLEREAGVDCDRAMPFRAGPLLALNEGVIARLPPVGGASDIARAWLGAIGAASGVDAMDRARLVTLCARAETRPLHAPDRALALAIVEGGAEAARAALADSRPDWQGRDAAAVLGGLALLADGPGRREAQGLVAPLEAAAARGHPAAMAVLALLLLDGTHLGADPDRAAALLTRAEARMPVAAALHAAIRLSPAAPFAGWRGPLAPDPQGALDSLRLARRHGVTIAPAVLDAEALAGRLLAGCEAALLPLAPDGVFALTPPPPPEALRRMFADPAAHLAGMLAPADRAAIAAACADLPATDDLPETLRARRDAIRLGLALGDLAGGDRTAARARLDDIATPLPGAALLAALLTPSQAVAEPLIRAGERLPAAAVALALIETRSSDPAHRGAGFARLRRLGDAGLAAADALLALRLMEHAAEAARAGGADPAAALTEAVLRVLAAGRGGMAIDLPDAMLAGIAAQAAARLGLALAPLGPDHAALLGPGSGVLVLSGPGGEAPATGDVLLRVAGRDVSSPAQAELALFSALLGALLGSGPVTLGLVPIADGVARETVLALPPALGAIAVPAALRR